MGPLIARGYIGEIDLKRKDVLATISSGYANEVIRVTFARDSAFLHKLGEKLGIIKRGKMLKDIGIPDKNKHRITIMIE